MPVLSVNRKIGDTIATSKPLCFALKDELIRGFCSSCLKKEAVSLDTTLKRCSRCKTVAYCGRECQEKDWKYHKIECVAFSKFQPDVIDIDLRLAARYITRICSRDWPDETVCDKTVNIDDIGGNLKLVLENPEQLDQFLKFYTRLRHQILMHQKGYDPSFDEVLQAYVGVKTFAEEMPRSSGNIKVYGDLCPDSKGCFSVSDGPIGNAIYLSTAVIPHSCNPNVVVHNEGFDAVVKAIKPIAPNEELRRSYVTKVCGRTSRQAELLSRLIADCACALCTADSSLETIEDASSECKAVVDTLTQRSENEVELLCKKDGRVLLDDIRMVLDREPIKSTRDNNEARVSLHRIGFEVASKIGDQGAAFKHGSFLTPYMRTILSPYSMEYITHLNNLSMLCDRHTMLKQLTTIRSEADRYYSEMNPS